MTALDIFAGFRGGFPADTRLKNANGELDSILANGNVGSDEHSTVTILKSDYVFDSSCAALIPISYLRTVAQSNTSKEFGVLVVGKDIHPPNLYAGPRSGSATGRACPGSPATSAPSSRTTTSRPAQSSRSTDVVRQGLAARLRPRPPDQGQLITEPHRALDARPRNSDLNTRLSVQCLT
jgi:hypothetical protein